MGVGSREFHTFLCDSCGREVIAEKGTTVDGYYIEVQQVRRGVDLASDNVYACSDVCVERAIHDALKRATLPAEQKLTATEELWLKGRVFNTDPRMPIYDASDDRRVIGSAKDVTNYKPSPRPIARVANEAAVSALDPDWKTD